MINADDSVTVYDDPTVGDYDGGDDTLVGIVNNSTTAVDSVTVSGPGSDLAGFDGDGLCSYITCTWAAPTGYEGPNNTFVTRPTDGDEAEVDFIAPLADGDATYFSLEGTLTSAALTARKGHLGDTWVAMGDSFSSGEGAEWFYPGTDSPGTNECRRSDAYASIANQSLPSPYPSDKFLFTACSGARIRDVLSQGQYPNSPNGIHGGKPQIQYLQEVGSRAGVVTLTIGGNDMGFADILKACTGAAILDSGKGKTYDVPWLTSFDPTAKGNDWQQLAGACDRYRNSRLGSFADGVESNIDSKRLPLANLYRAVAAAAPNADVYVLGYPVFIPGENTATPSCGGLVGLNGQERTWLRTVIERVNSTIKNGISDAGDSRIHFVDVEQSAETIASSDGKNHLICADAPYFHGASVHGDLPSHDQFHPKREEHVEMAERLVACINDPSQCNPPKPWKMCDGKEANIYGTDGNDELRGLDTAHQDVIVALGGQDVVNALNGNDVVCGGSGDDRLYGMGDNDRLFGQDGNDLVDGGSASDFCDGGPGSDRHADCESRVNFP
ncbi:MAG: GDSL-type esterase/lipase family protein [Marmoricola sp.]